MDAFAFEKEPLSFAVVYHIDLDDTCGTPAASSEDRLVLNHAAAVSTQMAEAATAEGTNE